MKMYLYLFGTGIAVFLMMVSPVSAQWNNMGSYLYTTDNITIGANTSSRQLFITGDNSVVRLDRSQNSPGFMIVRTQNGVGPLKTFLCGVTAWGQDEGRFVIEDLHQTTSGSGDVRLAIDEDGNVGIGTITPDSLLHVAGGDISLDNNEYLQFAATDGDYDGRLRMTGTNNLMLSNASGGHVMLGIAHNLSGLTVMSDNSILISSLIFGGNGPVYANLGYLTMINPSSAEYKKNIGPVDLDAERILQLSPRSYTWKNNDKEDFGYIAEEVKEVIPELYRDDGKTKGYDQAKLPFYIIEIIKDQDSQIKQLQMQMARQQTQIELLTTQSESGK